MATTSHTYAFTHDLGDTEIEVFATYDVTWGRAATWHDPADPDEVDDLRIAKIEGCERDPIIEETLIRMLWENEHLLIDNANLELV